MAQTRNLNPNQPPSFPFQVNSQTPLVQTVPSQKWLIELKKKSDVEQANQHRRDYTEGQFARIYEKNNTVNSSKNFIEATQWKRVDKIGDPLSDDTNKISEAAIFYDLTQPGFYMNDGKVLIEVNENRSIKIVDPAGKDENQCIGIMFDAIALNRSSPTAKIEIDDNQEMTKRQMRILRMDRDTRVRFRNRTEQMIKIAEEKGLSIKFDDNYKRLISMAGLSETKTIVETNGTKTQVPWAVYMQREEDRLLQNQIGTDGYWTKEFIRDRDEFSEHVMKEYQGEINELLHDIKTPDLITTDTLMKNTNGKRDPNGPAPADTKGTNEHLIAKLELLSALHANMQEQMERQLPQARKTDVEFIDKLNTTIKDNLKKLLGDPATETLLKEIKVKETELSNALKPPADGKPGLSPEDKKEKTEQLEKIQKVKTLFEKLPEEQKNVNAKAQQHQEKINEKLHDTGIASRKNPT